MLPLSGYPFDQDQLTNLINHTPDPTVICEPQYLLLDQNRTTVADITRAAGTSATSGSSTTISCNADNPVALTTGCALLQNRLHELGVNFNPLSHLVQIWLQYYSVRKKPLFSVPIGLFCFKWPKRTLDETGNVWVLSGSDLTQRLKDTRFKNSYVAPQGQDYTAAAQRIMTLDPLTGTTPSGLPCGGQGIPTSRINVPASGRLLPIPQTWDYATDQLTAIDALYTSALLYPLRANALGTYWSKLIPYYKAGMPNSVWTLTTDESSIIYDAVTQEMQGDFANRARVQADQPTGNPIVATAENHSTDSWVSFENLGFWVDAAPISDPNIGTQAQAQDRANLAVQQASTLNEQITCVTSFIPWIEPHDFVSVNVITADGVHEIDSSGYPFEVVGFTTDLESFRTTWTLRQSVPV